jgi:hypothetical protein
MRIELVNDEPGQRRTGNVKKMLILRWPKPLQKRRKRVKPRSSWDAQKLELGSERRTPSPKSRRGGLKNEKKQDA